MLDESDLLAIFVKTLHGGIMLLSDVINDILLQRSERLSNTPGTRPKLFATASDRFEIRYHLLDVIFERLQLLSDSSAKHLFESLIHLYGVRWDKS